jgi:transcription elongation factor GreA
VIDESAIDYTTVGVGATVKLTNMTDKSKLTFQIVGSAETDPRRGASQTSRPCGKAVLGHKTGDVVEATTPGGTLKLKINAIGK